jgi:chemotaxis protein CheZ
MDADREELDKEYMLEQSLRMVAFLEEDDEASARELLDDMTGIRETEIYKDLGKITRELHDALSGFAVDSRVSELAETEMPSAEERLNYVIKVTDEAAHTTLTALEEIVPMSEVLDERARGLSEEWDRFNGRKMSVAEFKELSGSIETYLQDTTVQTAVFQQKLTDVLMAQGFQDITGQIIRHVISLVQEVEASMVGLIKAASGGVERSAPKSVTEMSEGSHILEGPVIPGVNDNEAVTGQDDVDDLLSSLGF